MFFSLFVNIFSTQINKSEKPESCDNVKVVVRCRPLNEREKSMCYKQAVMWMRMRGTINVHKTDSSNELKDIYF